ncbi:chaperonin 10-like protein [Phialemonium atrogriseum]|uniref:Chaperonin 10-like protein n=1 Tax=Phialemonium atrogriseum TaxID=1093897 RepID=A0AAJ0BXV2_9PEZI|nr:chaperonin 10-like protein [Phialemonium atrogriseum]KAK1765872.1 chaperonin 10-like protein [Phialemonium atrogriseum]
MSATMEAIVITKFGGPEVLEHKQVPRPTAAPGEVLLRVKAFGLNHAELHMRRGEWDEWDPISGIECVGVVESSSPPSSSELFPTGATAVAVMGGMGRNRPGSYGELVSVPAANVAVVRRPAGLRWEDLAALPEAYCTAWSCLFSVLDLRPGERLLVRGATSTLGQAALHLAVDAGAEVTATTRREPRLEVLRGMGAAEARLEGPGFADGFDRPPRFDKVLNLVGNSVLLESVGLARPGGRVLQAGWLGGLEPLDGFNPMLQMETGVHFSLFHSKVLGGPDFPLKGIPLQDIVDKIARGGWDAKPARVFEYGAIREAHRLLDSHDAGGKIVVKH